MSKSGTTSEHVRSSLPTWKCHKVVRAAPIRSVYPADHQDGIHVVYLDGGPPPDGYPSFCVPSAMFTRYMSKPGDYFVVYDDGYESVSPKKAFEEGYMRIVPQQAELGYDRRLDGWTDDRGVVSS
jgi:hypothetical protein